MEPQGYDAIPSCNILYFVGGTALLAEYSRWRYTIDQKMVAVHGSPCAITPRTLVLIAGHATSITKILKCVNKNFKIELREIDSKSGMMLLLDLHYSEILFQRLLSDRRFC
jgi:hypothetical protein